MSYWKQIELIDDLGNVARITNANELRTIEPVRVAGSIMSAAQVDPNFWATTLVGTGSVTQSNLQQTLATGATANSSAASQSVDFARFIGQSQERYVGQVALGDTGTANNERRWGAFNGTDGCYFKINGTTVYACTRKGGVETAVPSASWNLSTTLPTLTNTNAWQILYSLRTVEFFIGGTPVHRATFTGPWTNTLVLPARHDNTNSGGSTSNVSMSLMAATIYRLGQVETQPKYVHITGAGTTVCKYSAGLLHSIIINAMPASGSSTLNLYDNTAGSGTIIGIPTGSNTGAPVALDYKNLQFNIGLTVVSAGTAWDLTVIYQ